MKKLNLKPLINLKKNLAQNFKWLTILPVIKSSNHQTKIILPVAPILLGVVVALSIIAGVYLKNRPTSSKELEMMEIISSVVDLPAETPQVAIVSDTTQLNQPFFEKAQNGDYVIVYQQTGKVLLYRPATKKIINFANIQIPTSQTELFTNNN